MNAVVIAVIVALPLAGGLYVVAVVVCSTRASRRGGPR